MPQQMQKFLMKIIKVLVKGFQHRKLKHLKQWEYFNLDFFVMQLNALCHIMETELITLARELEYIKLKIYNNSSSATADILFADFFI